MSNRRDFMKGLLVSAAAAPVLLVKKPHNEGFDFPCPAGTDQLVDARSSSSKQPPCVPAATKRRKPHGHPDTNHVVRSDLTVNERGAFLEVAFEDGTTNDNDGHHITEWLREHDELHVECLAAGLPHVCIKVAEVQVFAEPAAFLRVTVTGRLI